MPVLVTAATCVLCTQEERTELVTANLQVATALLTTCTCQAATCNANWELLHYCCVLEDAGSFCNASLLCCLPSSASAVRKCPVV